MAGLLALSYLMDATQAAPTSIKQAQDFIDRAAWLIFLGMLCDGLDGRIARMTHSTSAFGAQLDSLADVVTFGVTPALLARTVLGISFPSVPGRVLVAVGVVYLLGGAFRLARYNVESARTDDDEAHVTRIFRGLPSPAAAGVVASIVILRGHLGWHGVDFALLAVTPLLGLLMISRLPYAHLLNRYFDGPRPLATVVGIMVMAYLAVLYFEETVAAGFTLYALSGPCIALVSHLAGHPEWAYAEEGDEADGDFGTRGYSDEDDEDEDDDAADDLIHSRGAPRDAR